MKKVTIELTHEQIQYIKAAYRHIQLGIDHCPSASDLEVLGFFGSVVIDIQDQVSDQQAQ